MVCPWGIVQYRSNTKPFISMWVLFHLKKKEFQFVAMLRGQSFFLYKN